MLKQRAILILAAITTALCAVGLVHMFVLRYESGDVYAAYSSLRSDPKGCKVLCESLNRLPNVSATRNLKDLSRWSGAETDKTIVFAGYGLWSFRYEKPEIVERLYDLAAAGNRVIVTLAPTTMRNSEEADEEALENAEDFIELRRELKGEKLDDEDDVDSEWTPWQVEIQFAPLPEETEDRYALFAPISEDTGLRVPWNSTAAFTHPDEEWTVVGHRDQMPVLLERDIGAGSLVLCADSYFLSNEAQLKERSTPFLLWLLGPHREIVFDETHLGVASSPGIATLIRQYRLHGLMGGLFLLAGLFIWKNLFSLVPRHDEELAETEVEGKDQTEGLVNLLQHNIPARDLLPECERVWRNSLRFLPHVGAERQAEVRSALAHQQPGTRPETLYQQLQLILSKRNSHEKHKKSLEGPTS